MCTCRVHQYCICWKSSFIKKPYAVASMITSIYTNMAMQKQKTSGMSLASMQINHWMLRYKSIITFLIRKLSYLPKSIILLYHIKCKYWNFICISQLLMHTTSHCSWFGGSHYIWWRVNYEADSDAIFSVFLLFVSL